MLIDIKCPKCDHEFKKNIEDVLPKNEITDQEKQDLIEQGKQDERIGRAKDKQNYLAEIESLSKKLKKSQFSDKGKVAEEILENFLNKKFPQHPTKPIPSGQAGGDIIMEINSNNEIIGTILFESKKDYDNFQSKWVEKLKGDIKKDNADYGIIVTTVLPANHDTSLPYLEFMDGLIYAVNSNNNQNVYSIVDKIIGQIKNDYANKKNNEKKMHNLSDKEKNASTFIETENIQLLIDLHYDKKKAETDLNTIERSHIKTTNLLKNQIKGKEDQFNNLYEQLDNYGVDLTKVDEILEK